MAASTYARSAPGLAWWHGLLFAARSLLWWMRMGSKEITFTPSETGISVTGTHVDVRIGLTGWVI